MPHLYAKKIIPVFVISLSALLPFVASADILPQCSLTYGDVAGSGAYKICGLCDFWHLANNVVNFLLFTVSIPLLTIVFLYGGTRWVTSGGSPSGISAGKDAMTSAIIGLLIAFSGWAVINTIVTSLANGEISAAWSKIPSCVKPDVTSIPGLDGFAAGTGLTNALLDGGGFENGYQTDDPVVRALSNTGRGSGGTDISPSGGAIATVMNRLKAYDGQCNGMPFADFITQEARRKSVDPDRVFAVIAAESGGRADARSPVGAVGLMQMIPSTASRYGVSQGDLTNACKNAIGGISYYSDLYNKFGNYDAASAGYNGGPGAVGDSRDCPGTKKWRCAWNSPGCYPAATTNNTSCSPNTGYRETRQYVCNIRAFEAQKKGGAAPPCGDIEMR